MATQTISTYSNAVNSAYDKRMPAFINGAADLIPWMNKGTILPYSGEDYLYSPWKIAYGEGTKWTVPYDGTNGTYPTALSPQFDKFRLSWKKLLGKFQLNNELVDIQKGVHNFVSVYSDALADMIEVFKLDLNAALHGSGTGSLATCASYSGQVVTVDTTKYIRVGMVLDGYDASDNKDADGIVVTAINSDTTFTCTGTVTSIDSATVLYKKGSWVTTLDYAPNGIANIIDDDTGTFQNLSRSTYPQIRAKITDGDTPGTNQALTLPRVRGVLDKIEKGEAGKVQPGTIAYGTLGCVNAFRDLLATENQPTATIASKAGDAEVPAWQYGSTMIPFFGSSRAIDNTLFFIDPKSLLKYLGKQKWDTHGGGLLKPLEAGPAVWGSLALWIQFGTNFPAKNGRLNDVTET